MIKIEDIDIGDIILIQQKFNSNRLQRLLGKIYEVTITQFSMNRHLFKVQDCDDWLKVDDYNFIDKIV